MMQQRTPSGVRALPAASGRVDIDDVSCGACSACAGGAPLWCENPVEHGVVLCSVRADSREQLQSLLILASVDAAQIDDDQVIVVVGHDDDDALVRLLRLVHGGDVLAGTDLKAPELRSVLSASRPSGRADVVATLGSARDAVRAVARGGTVCLTGTTASDATVTEVVQREVRLVGPKDLRSVIDRAGRQSVERELHAA
jgi:threonine dehydrogenase-like Zn-dependent dehydrogenase